MKNVFIASNIDLYVEDFAKDGTPFKIKKIHEVKVDDQIFDIRILAFKDELIVESYRQDSEQDFDDILTSNPLNIKDLPEHYEIHSIHALNNETIVKEINLKEVYSSF